MSYRAPFDFSERLASRHSLKLTTAKPMITTATNTAHKSPWLWLMLHSAAALNHTIALLSWSLAQGEKLRPNAHPTGPPLRVCLIRSDSGQVANHQAQDSE